MINFNNDYTEGAHLQILKALSEANMEYDKPYGLDSYCEKAALLIQERLGTKDCEIFFMVGGTQTNATFISHVLKPYQAVIAAGTGHINVHETGAIEGTGHKVIGMKTTDGKLTRALIEAAVEEHEDEHMVQPKMVYISNSTELGTIYHKKELEELRKVCDEYGLVLYLDGARLGAALTCAGNDLALEDYARLTDAFYIGGTKNGALFGEALVVLKDSLREDMRYSIKQKGALLAKGRLLGIQFQELFQDGLYESLASHANQMSELLKTGLAEAGYKFLIDSSTNQQFPVFSDKAIEELSKKYAFLTWKKMEGGNSCIRLVTSWATKEDDIRSFLKDSSALNKNLSL